MKAINSIFVSVETTSFSGATLLAFLLNTHPQIISIGEMNGLIPAEDPDEYLCSCGKKIKTCDFWQSVTTVMNKKGFEFNVADFDMQFLIGNNRFIQRLRTGSFRNNTLDTIRDTVFQAWPAERHQIKKLVARNQALVEAVLEVSGKDVFVDTSKDRLRLKALTKYSTLDVRVIHLVRDVRGVVASWIKRNRQNVPAAAQQWVKWHRRLELSLQAWPAEKQILIRYEDLCADTEKTLQQLYNFCGVDPEIGVTDFRTASHHIVGNQMRLTNTSEIKLDEKWRTSLTAKQIEVINQVAGDFNKRYGYL